MRIEIRKEPDARFIATMEPNKLHHVPHITVLETPSAFTIGFGLAAGACTATLAYTSIVEIVRWLAT